MRILTVRQPWAWAIVHGGKDVENRVRNIAGDYRGPVAIHVAQADAETAPDGLWLMHGDWYRARARQPKKFEPAFWDRGRIIGVVDLAGIHRSGACDKGPTWQESPGFHALPYEGCSPWAENNAHHLVLANPRPISEPIPYKGALGLRTLPDAVAAQINNALETP